MLLTGAALAEPFAFRNGVAWGMNDLELLAAEGEPEPGYGPGMTSTDTYGDDLVYMYFYDVSAAGAKADLTYTLRRGALFMIAYIFKEDAISWKKLVASYTLKYGEPQPPELDDVADRLEVLIGPDGDIASEFEAYLETEYMATWRTEDTCILAVHQDGSHCVAYFGLSEMDRQMAADPEMALSTDGI